MSTSVEDPSSTPVAVRATAPASPAPLSHTPSTLIPTMPATCTMAIIGIATMFRTNPAIPTRLNSVAATGKSVSSAASVAPHSPTSHRRPNAGVVSPGQRASCQATIRPAPTMMPNVAPKLSHAPASMTVSGSASVTMTATTARTFRAGGTRPIDADRQVHQRDRDSPRHGRIAADDPPVRDDAGHREAGDETSRSHDESQAEIDASRQQRDVAAGDRNHVIRAGDLQATLEWIVEPRPVADQNSDDDGAGGIVWIRKEAGDPLAHARAHRRGPLVPPSPRRDVNDECALDATREHERATEYLPPLRWATRIQPYLWLSERHRRANGTAGGPVTYQSGGKVAADICLNASADNMRPAVVVDAVDIDEQTNSGIDRGRVVDEPPVHDDRWSSRIGFRSAPEREWRVEHAVARGRTVRHRCQDCGSDDKCRTPASAPARQRPGSRSPGPPIGTLRRRVRAEPHHTRRPTGRRRPAPARSSRHCTPCKSQAHADRPGLTLLTRSAENSVEIPQILAGSFCKAAGGAGVSLRVFSNRPDRTGGQCREMQSIERGDYAFRCEPGCVRIVGGVRSIPRPVGFCTSPVGPADR